MNLQQCLTIITHDAGHIYSLTSLYTAALSYGHYCFSIPNEEAKAYENSALARIPKLVWVAIQTFWLHGGCAVLLQSLMT